MNPSFSESEEEDPMKSDDLWIFFLQQFNQYYLNLCQYCQSNHDIEKWIAFQSDLKSKLDYVSRAISYYPQANSVIFDVEHFPQHSSVKELEEIKKEIQQTSFPIPQKFKLRANAPAFIPNSFTPPPGMMQSPRELSNAKGGVAKAKTFAGAVGKSPFQSIPSNSGLPPKPASSLISWSSASKQISPTRDDWDEDSFRDEINKASEQIWAEAEAWMDAQDAVEDEEWEMFFLRDLLRNAGLADSKTKAGKKDEDSLYVETSFDNLLDQLIHDEGDGAHIHSPVTNETESSLLTPLKSSPSANRKTRSLHEKLSSPDRKRALSPTQLRRKIEAKLRAADSNRDKSMEEKIQKAMIASNRVKEYSLKEQQRKAQQTEALKEKLREHEVRHSEKLNEIKEKAGSEIAKVSEVISLHAQNADSIHTHLQQKFKEVEAKLEAATQRREQLLKMKSGSEKKKNNRKAQQMSEFRLQLEKEKMERWEKFKKRFESVQDRRKKRLEEVIKRAEEASIHSSTVANLSHLTLGDESKLSKNLQAYSPKMMSFLSPNSEQNHYSPDEASPGKTSSRHVSAVHSPIRTAGGTEGHLSPQKEAAASSSQTFSPEENTYNRGEGNVTFQQPYQSPSPEKHLIPANSLSFDPHESSASKNNPGFGAGQILTAFSKSSLSDYDLAISRSEEIEVVLFPAVAKSHARFLELIKRPKIANSRQNIFLLSLKCLENNKDFLSHQFYSIVSDHHSNEGSPAVPPPGSSSGNDLKQPSQSFSPVKDIQGNAGNHNSPLTPFQKLIDNIEVSKRSLHSEERGASSYNIYASIIKEIRILGINCNIDLAEKINFLVGNLLEAWGTGGGKPVVNSLGMDDFIRSGGLLLLPVLISYEYGVLSDLSSVQNFINSLVVFSRSFPVHEKSSTRKGASSSSNQLPQEIIELNHYKDSVLLHLANYQTTATSQNAAPGQPQPPMISSLFQQIDFCSLIDLFTFIICEYASAAIDANILFGLSMNITLFDLCLFLHYLLSHVYSETSESSSDQKGSGNRPFLSANNFTGDIVYRYSLAVIRSKTGKVVQLLAKTLDSTVQSILSFHHGNLTPEKEKLDERKIDSENVPAVINQSSSREDESVKLVTSQSLSLDPLDEVMSQQKAEVLFEALLAFQQHSFMCSFMNVLFDQCKLQLLSLQSSLTFFHSSTFLPTDPSSKGNSNNHNLVQVYTILEELPTHFDYFSAIVAYTTSIANFLLLLQEKQDKQQLTVVKHWISQLRRNGIMKLILDIFYFGYDCLFLLLDFPSFHSPAFSESLYLLMKQRSLSTSMILTLIHSSFEAMTKLVQIEPDLFKQISGQEKAQFVERITNYFILIVFILDKSKDIKDILHLRVNHLHEPSQELINFISSEFKDCHECYELSLQKLCLLLSRLILYDYEYRKMIGESCEKRLSTVSGSMTTESGGQQSSSQLLEDISKNKIIHLILIYGTNHPGSGEKIDPSKALMLRQKLNFLQMICLLSVKYYKDSKLKPILLSVLMISSMENELNSQIIQYYKKDKLIQKYLGHYLKEKESFEHELEMMDVISRKKKEEKLKSFHELVPENVVETLKIIWLK